MVSASNAWVEIRKPDFYKEVVKSLRKAKGFYGFTYAPGGTYGGYIEFKYSSDEYDENSVKAALKETAEYIHGGLIELIDDVENKDWDFCFMLPDKTNPLSYTYVWAKRIWKKNFGAKIKSFC